MDRPHGQRLDFIDLQEAISCRQIGLASDKPQPDDMLRPVENTELVGQLECPPGGPGPGGKLSINYLEHLRQHIEVKVVDDISFATEHGKS